MCVLYGREAFHEVPYLIYWLSVTFSVFTLRCWNIRDAFRGPIAEIFKNKHAVKKLYKYLPSEREYSVLLGMESVLKTLLSISELTINIFSS